MFAALEIFDLDSRTSETLLETDRHIEAPNWAAGGLIVNADGLLYRVPFDAPELIEIDTGGHDGCNNDHGLSPDGRRLAFSDSSTAGESCIYAIASAGGLPERITALTPSWWHGWSPDGEWLAYTCRRDGDFGIAVIPAAGGEERVLIAVGGHYDGPDYTPDGKHIWFNSDRGGQMNLWRMGPAGETPEEMTGGESVDWFPHPSPDGRHVLYLAYPKGTEGHPFGREVELRLMPAEGGASETLCAFFGGQGTINVPSWAPDGRRFAYVRYARP